MGHILLALVSSRTHLNRGHAGVVPSSHEATLYELEEFPLGQNGVGDVQARHFVDLVVDGGEGGGDG